MTSAILPLLASAARLAAERRIRAKDRSHAARNRSRGWGHVRLSCTSGTGRGSPSGRSDDQISGRRRSIGKPFMQLRRLMGTTEKDLADGDFGCASPLRLASSITLLLSQSLTVSGRSRWPWASSECTTTRSPGSTAGAVARSRENTSVTDPGCESR